MPQCERCHNFTSNLSTTITVRAPMMTANPTKVLCSDCLTKLKCWWDGQGEISMGIGPAFMQ